MFIEHNTHDCYVVHFEFGDILENLGISPNLGGEFGDIPNFLGISPICWGYPQFKNLQFGRFGGVKEMSITQKHIFGDVPNSLGISPKYARCREHIFEMWHLF